MARQLTQHIKDQISAKDIQITFVFKVNGTDYSSYLSYWSIEASRAFGANNGIFVLDNNTGKFGEGGSDKIEVGDVVEFIEIYTGDATQWKRFYGVVNQRGIAKGIKERSITLNCLDYIASTQVLDLDLKVEGIRVKVTEEVLEPIYLAAPNDDLAQLFNFANNNIATHPLSLVRFRDKNHTDTLDTQYDGFEIYYDAGQLKLGVPLNVKENFDVLSTYFYYTKGKYAEDIIEEILKKEDGYGGYLFDETSAQNVVDNHLKSDFNAEQGTNIDTLTPNLEDVTLTIEHQLVRDYDPDESGFVPVLYLDSVEGLPTSGSGEVNGDIFTWSGIGSGNTLTGIPTSGSNALKTHRTGDYFKYETSYPAGKVWGLSYDNLLTSLTTGDFTLPSGSVVDYLDKRYGRIILDSAIPTDSNVKCNTNYSFKTIQATGIELNRIVFRPREINNRFEAINKVKVYLAPNYIVRTQGDNKIWASYLNQRTTANYELELVERANYLEDEDLYTRSLMWAKNENPTNLMFGDDVDYSSDVEDEYTGTVSKEELVYFGEEKSGVLSEWATNVLSEAELLHQTPTQELINYVKEKYIDKDYATQGSTGYHIFGTTISDRGRVILGEIVPIVYVNAVPIDNKAHQQVGVPVQKKVTTKTITEGGGKSKSVSVTTYYYYSFILPHGSIDPNQTIYVYDNKGLLQYTINPNDPNMNYAKGVYTVPGTSQNSIAETISTATYWVIYSTEKLVMEYDDVIFKIHRSILPDPKSVVIQATFEYWAIAVAVRDIRHVVDGRRDTQLQIEFFGQPPAGFHLGTVDLGAIHTIQAIDLVGGFFKPDEHRRFDCGFRMSIQYSTDGTNFYAISDKTENFEVDAGEAISFDEEDLGIGFQARYLKFTLQEVDRISYGRGRYVVALTEVSVYSDIVLQSEAKLIATTKLTSDVNPGDVTINVSSTLGFTEPTGSGETHTAYLDKDSNKPFTYTGLTATSFTGCDVGSGISASSGEYVTQTIESDDTLYDDGGLLPQLGDRVFKKIMISDRNLYSQSELDAINKAYLKEFVKNHSKLNIEILYAPYLKIGHTIHLLDADSGIDNNYFIEGITDRKGFYSLVLARYPA